MGLHGRDRMGVRFTSSFLCNLCLSPLKVWVCIAVMVWCTRYNIKC